MLKKNKAKQIVKKYYSEIANGGGCCCCAGRADNEQIAKSIGYSNEEIKSGGEANLGLGCGNPTGMGEIRRGETVLDLGSGGGFDCLLAAKKVGDSGKVIGVDMTEEMIEKARFNAEKQGYKNIEFRPGDIENLPVDDNSIDVVISNCVVNLAPDKAKVFKEVYRVLKKGGRMYISDIVLLGDLAQEQKENEELIAGCVAGALPRSEYLKIIKNAGFKIKILSEDKDIGKRQYRGMPIESLEVEARK